jgi:dipeptidyl aminopeptidase/acylaminoacyl peptidase
MKQLLSAALAFVFAMPAIAQARPFTAHDLVTLDRLSDVQSSPSGTAVLYDLRVTDLAANKSRHSIWIVGTDGASTPRRLIDDATNARWSPDGRYVYVLSSRSSSEQIWRASSDGTGLRQVTDLPLDVQTFRIAPDGRHLVVALAVFPDCTTLACTVNRANAKAASKATGTLYTRLFIRHWDTWADGTRNHLFALTIDGAGKASGPISLMRDFDGDTPSKPSGDEHDFAISPDSRTVVFSARHAGHSEPWSTNFDLYRVPMNGSLAPQDITKGNPAWDGQPVFSPDGTRLAYVAQKHPGHESDRFGVMVMNVRTGATREIDPQWDRSAGSLAWSLDGRTIYTDADDVQQHRVFAISVADGAVQGLTGAGDVENFTVGARGIAYAQSSLEGPAQAYALAGMHPQQLTHVDAAKLAGVDIAPSQAFTFTGWNGEKVYGRVTQPGGYRPGHRYPVAFLIHGGPQGSWTNGWSYRWNPQFYAGLGYAVVTVDFHGSTGYGQAFTNAISQHWGDRPLEDLQKGWAAALAQFPYLNANRACALGASYGGYMIDWIAGNWNQPWKCLVVHDGVFDNRMMGYSTEELWFAQWENGGTPWEHPENYERFNPIDHVANWKDPMLVIHSSLDFRIPIDQGIAAFTALQRRGIPSEFLTFPNENHWVLRPADSLQWHQTVAAWLKRWLNP